jgi:hypothetical protein
MFIQQNYDYLRHQLLMTGFGDALNAPLREKLEQGAEKFSLQHSRLFGEDETFSTLHFSKASNGDHYFFNAYDLVLRRPGEEEVKQHVFINDKYNYTLKERYNLLNGRAVFKEQPVLSKDQVTGKLVPNGQTYLAWRDLDLKNTDKLGNFVSKTMYWEHKKELQSYPIKELSVPYDKNKLVATLEKGDKAKVTIVKDDQEIKGLVAANPRQQRLDFYDSQGQRMSVRKTEKQVQDQVKQLKAPQLPASGEAGKPAQDKTASQKQENTDEPTRQRTRHRLRLS